jgi:Mitochondrial carrier protein
MELIDPMGLQTRMQIINPSAGGLYTGLSNAVSTIYRIEGLRTLWRGVSSVVVGAGGIFRNSWIEMVAHLGYRTCACCLLWHI